MEMNEPSAQISNDKWLKQLDKKCFEIMKLSLRNRHEVKCGVQDRLAHFPTQT